MKHDSIASGQRKPVNMSLDTGIVATAREVGLNLSQISETAIREATKREMERRWKDEHRAAMEASNDWLEKHGLPYAELRVF